MIRGERLAILRGLPKVDLHRHLEGAMRLDTLLELGRKRGVDMPLDSPESLGGVVCYNEGEPRSLAHFLGKFHDVWYASYADVERVAAEAVYDAAEEGVVHLELRFSPEHFCRKTSLKPLEVMRAVASRARAAGEEMGIGARLLITFARERQDFDAWKAIVDRAAEMADEGVAGVDLAGDEFGHPNEEFVRIFQRVADTGSLRATVHAGEGTSAAQVASAVERLHAQRIGHGVQAIDDEAVVSLLVRRGVALEICPISNHQTGCVHDLQDHPLPALDRLGVRVTLNSDDPAIHRSTINDEYDVAITRWAYGLADLERLEMNAVEAAFLDEDETEALRDRVRRGYQESRGQGLS
ncbi:MAG: adenosine deaminase [Deltaproteobacteria bacterium]|nr:adenosine deaminase [Deltaproteobacteria bacterium]